MEDIYIYGLFACSIFKINWLALTINTENLNFFSVKFCILKIVNESLLPQSYSLVNILR